MTPEQLGLFDGDDPDLMAQYLAHFPALQPSRIATMQLSPSNEEELPRAMAVEMLPKKLWCRLRWDVRANDRYNVPEGWGFYIREVNWAVGVVVYGCGVDGRDGSDDVVFDMGWGYSGRDRVGTVLSCRADGVGVGVAVEVQR